jgi:hypothetical protein
MLDPSEEEGTGRIVFRARLPGGEEIHWVEGVHFDDFQFDGTLRCC